MNKFKTRLNIMAIYKIYIIIMFWGFTDDDSGLKSIAKIVPKKKGDEKEKNVIKHIATLEQVTTLKCVRRFKQAVVRI